MKIKITRYLKLKFYFHLFLFLSYFSILAINFTGFAYAVEDITEQLTTETKIEFNWVETDNGVKSNIAITDNQTYTYENVGIKFFNLPSESLKLFVSKIGKSALPDETQAESDAYDIKLLDEDENEITEGFNIQVTFYEIENTDDLSVISFQDTNEISQANLEESNIDDGNIVVTADHLTIFVVVKVVDHTSGSGEQILSNTPADNPDAPLPTTININDNSPANASTYIKTKGWWSTVSTNVGTDYIDFHFGDITGINNIDTITFLSNLRMQVASGSGGADISDFDAKLYGKKGDGSFLDLAIDKYDLVPNFSSGESGASSNYELISIPLAQTDLDLTDFVIRYSLASEHLGPHAPTVATNGLIGYFDYAALDVTYVSADTTPPAIPTGISIFQNNVNLGCNAYTTTRTIKIDWADNTELDLDHYVYQNLSGTFTTSLTDSEFSGDMADLDGVYGYRVKAVDTIGNESAWTDYCYITLDRVSPAMSNIKMKVDGTETYTPKVGDNVTISATVTDALSPVDKVQIWVRAYPYTGEQITSGEMVNTAGNTWEFNFTMPDNYASTNPISENLLANYFNFRPWDTTGNSTIGNTTKFTFVNPPSVPELVSPADGAIIKGVDAILDWTDETDLNGPVTYNYKSSWLPSGSYGPVSVGTTSQINATASAENTYFWQVQACDSFNNCSEWTVPFEVTIDNTAPTIPINGTPDNTAINTNNFDFNWDASTDVSTITYEYQATLSANETTGVLTTSLWNSGVLPSNTIHSSGASNGKWYWQVRAIDSAGNVSDWSEIWDITIDTVNPTVDLVFPTPGPAATSFQAVFNEDVNPTEAENPANYFLTNWPGVDGSGDLVGDVLIVYNPTTFTATITFTNAGWYISPEQQWGVENIQDLAGNLLSTTPYSEYSTPMVAPVTTDSAIDADWHNTAVTVTLTCADTSGSGCQTTYYTTDNINPDLSSLTGNSFALSTEGQYTIKYFSTDNAGNTETVKTATNTVKIDTTNPTGTVVINSDDTYTNNKTVTLTITSTDTLSGVSEMAFSNDGTTYSTPETFSNSKTWDLTDTEGLQTVYIKIIDLAGNEFITSDTIILDTTIPASTITIPSNTGSNTTTYTNTWDGVISGTSSDNYEVANVQLSIKRTSDGFYFNGTDWVTSASEILLNTTTGNLYTTWSYDINPDPAGDETYTIISHATDNTGNFESSYTLTVVYDITIPQVSLTINPITPNGDNNIYVSKPTITLTANDNYNVDYIQYQINSTSGTWTKYTKTVEINEGITKFYYRSIDKAGNISTVGLKNISIDLTTPDAVENVGASFSSTLTETSIYWEANDDDIDSIKIYKSQNSNIDQSSSNFFIMVDKNINEITDDDIDRVNTYYYLLVSYDEAGNQGESVKVGIKIPEDTINEIIVTTETIAAPTIVIPNTVTATDDGQVEGANTEKINKEEGDVLAKKDVNINLRDSAKDTGFISFLIKYWWLFLLTPFIFWMLWWVVKRNKN